MNSRFEHWDNSKDHDRIAKELVKEDIMKLVLSDIFNKIYPRLDTDIFPHLNCPYLSERHCKILSNNRPLIEGLRGKPLIPLQREYDKRSLCIWEGQQEYKDWKYCPKAEDIRKSKASIIDISKRWDPTMIHIISAKSEQIIQGSRDYTVGFIDHLVVVEARAENFYYDYTEENPFKFLIEIKSFVKSEGEVLRQMNLYRAHHKDAIPVLITMGKLADDSISYFEHNGVHAYEFDGQENKDSVERSHSEENAPFVPRTYTKGDETPPSARNSLEAIRQAYPRAYTEWGEEEDTRLRVAYSEGKTVSELAQLFQRQPGGIRMRLVKLGLIQDFRTAEIINRASQTFPLHDFKLYVDRTWKHAYPDLITHLRPRMNALRLTFAYFPSTKRVTIRGDGTVTSTDSESEIKVREFITEFEKAKVSRTIK